MLERHQTRARRQRHVRRFWREWLVQLEVVFISRVASGVVGVLWRLADTSLQEVRGEPIEQTVVL